MPKILNVAFVCLCVLATSAFAADRLPEETPYSVYITDVVDVSDVGERDAKNASIVFNKKVPNSRTQLLLLGVGGLSSNALIEAWTATDVKSGEPTQKLHIQWSPSKTGFGPDKLKGVVVQQISHVYHRYVRKIVDKGKVGERDFHNAELVLNEFVPNGDATLVADLGDGVIRHTLMSVTDIKTGHATTRIHTQWTLKELEKLEGKFVRIYSPVLP